MAKRYTDANKWDDPFFTDMPIGFKMCYLYILDKCDHIGVWKINKRNAEYFIGCKIDWDSFIDYLGDRVYKINEEKLWIVKFCTFQYGELSEDSKSNPILSYIKILKKNGLWKQYLKGIDTLPDGYRYPTDTLPDGYRYPTDTLPIPYRMGTLTLKEKEKEKEKDNVYLKSLESTSKDKILKTKDKSQKPKALSTNTSNVLGEKSGIRTEGDENLQEDFLDTLDAGAQNNGKDQNHYIPHHRRI